MTAEEENHLTAPLTHEPTEDGNFHEGLANFFRIDDPGFLKLRAALQYDWEWLVQEHRYLAASLSHATRTPRQADTVTEIAICTASDRKLAIMEGLVREAGFTPRLAPALWDEREIHQHVRYDPNFPFFYAMNVAKRKQGVHDLDTPTITTDTVVFKDHPLEKPGSRDEAIHDIAFLSGGQVTIITGLVIDIPTKSGRTIELGSEIAVSFAMKNASRQAIEKYVDTQSNVYAVAGGIDLTQPKIQGQFIDVTAPITISVTGFPDNREIEINAEAIGALTSYFAGVPMHPIQALLSVVQPIYTQI